MMENGEVDAAPAYPESRRTGVSSRVKNASNLIPVGCRPSLQDRDHHHGADRHADVGQNRDGFEVVSEPGRIDIRAVSQHEVLEQEQRDPRDEPRADAGGGAAPRQASDQEPGEHRDEHRTDEQSEHRDHHFEQAFAGGLDERDPDQDGQASDEQRSRCGRRASAGDRWRPDSRRGDTRPRSGRSPSRCSHRSASTSSPRTSRRSSAPSARPGGRRRRAPRRCTAASWADPSAPASACAPRAPAG